MNNQETAAKPTKPRHPRRLLRHLSKRNIFWSVMATALIFWGIWDTITTPNYQVIFVFLLGAATLLITWLDISANYKRKSR